MDIQNKIQGSITILPVGYEDCWPEVSIKLDQDSLFFGILQEPIEIQFNKLSLDKTHSLSVEFLNKKDSDTKMDTKQDKAIIVKQINFFGITSPRFVWAGEYRPIYPSHMVDQPEILKYHDYLGWNGVWTLNFTTPVFTWIHQTEDLGWIYD